MKDVTGGAGGSRLQRASNRAPISLGKELGRGGEGAVFPVVGAPGLVAKIYLKPPTPAKAEKLRSMARSASPALLRVAAWPVDVLLDPAGAIRGFLMPRVSAREDVHELYNPKSRRQAFPNVDFRFVARAAANISRAFAQVHAAGNVIGDVNHGNALVGRDGTVVLIDCDSFQVRDGARIFTCDVGVPLFTAPELAGQGFRGLRRSVNHDAFGLAVLLFHLLYLGRHPFAGKHVDGEMPIERAIAESRFVYGANAAHYGMTRPPGTLDLGTFGADIAQLFERAFAPPGDTSRPTPVQWAGALQALESRLDSCSASASHWFARPKGPDDGAPGCCWCTLEQHTGLNLFGSRESFEAQGNARLARLWDEIIAVPWPEAVDTVPVPRIPQNENRAWGMLGRLPRVFVSWVLVLLSFGTLLSVPGENLGLALLVLGAAVALRWEDMKPRWMRKRPWRMHHKVLAARKRLAAVAAEWNALAGDSRFNTLHGHLSRLKELLLGLPKQRLERLGKLMQEDANLQRYRFLDSVRLHKAKLPEVKPQEISMLKSFDIDSAADVLDRLEKVQGLISQRVYDEVLAWARARERDFAASVTPAVDPMVTKKVEAEIRKEQDDLLRQLSEGQQELAKLAADIAASREAKHAELDAARSALHEAKRKYSE